MSGRAALNWAPTRLTAVPNMFPTARELGIWAATVGHGIAWRLALRLSYGWAPG